ncbi:DNA-3-methyladenine glycosylase II [Apostasia shenzhenica]|uniref:DNA-3-methyladenine glycosylase II n=1 Tax=Apostasia shenzhenica TaxID=1088818 RepID=A0A2I0B2K5_9ASPA|nr:DNA-3-methyladenine glycosylase II [Apostasia shenzhenica]
MGEQTLTTFATGSVAPPSSSSASSSSSAPAASTASNDRKPSSPSSSSAANSSVSGAAVSSSTSSKIYFRSRKIRRSSVSSSEFPDDDALKKPRLAVIVLPHSLSDPGELDSALRHLRTADLLLASLIDAYVPPVFQNLDTPFHSLARSILYQQLALKAAASIHSRFVSLCGGEDSVVPDAVISLTPQQLRQIGVSGRKASYLHDLARKYQSGILSDSAIVAMDDRSLFTMLTMVKGIGPWSVHMFMIFSLHRPDVLPIGDLGVRKGVQMLYGLSDIPKPSQMEQLCERWRPYRSVGAWYMWRLMESKGTSTMASAGAVMVSPVPGGASVDAESSGDLQTRQSHAQLVDSIQMLPNLG